MLRTKKNKSNPSVNTAQPPQTAESWGEFLANMPHAVYKHKKVLGLLALSILGGVAMRSSSNQENNACTQYFDLYKGDMTNAKLLILGEVHNRKHETNACIAYYDPDIILVESVSLGVTVDCASKNINVKKDTLCIGWDAPEENEKNVQQGTRSAVVKFLKEFHKVYKTRKFTQPLTQMNQMIENFKHQTHGLVKKYQFTDIHAKKSIDFTPEEAAYQSNLALIAELEKISKLLLEKNSMDDIFATYQHEFDTNYHDGLAYYNPDDPDIVALMKKRNGSLIKAIDQYTTSDTKVAIQVGYNHIKIKKPKSERDDGVHDVHEALSTRNYYAVLTSKSHF